MEKKKVEGGREKKNYILSLGYIFVNEKERKRLHSYLVFHIPFF